MLTILFMDNSTQVVRVTSDFFVPSSIGHSKKLLSVAEKAESLAWSYGRKPAKASLTKGSSVIWHKEFGITQVKVKKVASTIAEKEEKKHLKKLYKHNN